MNNCMIYNSLCMIYPLHCLRIVFLDFSKNRLAGDEFLPSDSYHFNCNFGFFFMKGLAVLIELPGDVSHEAWFWCFFWILGRFGLVGSVIRLLINQIEVKTCEIWGVISIKIGGMRHTHILGFHNWEFL